MGVNLNSLIESVDKLKEGVKFYVDEKIKNAPFTKIYTGRIVGATDFGYQVLYNSKTYDDVQTIGGICLMNETVRIVIPDNNMNNMFILKPATNNDVINIQQELNRLQSDKLDKVGDSSNTTTIFSDYGSRVNISSGEKLSILFGKIHKWFTDLKNIAFTGNASDLIQDGAHRLVTDTEKTTWGNKAPTPHDSINTTYGLGTTAKFGHVKLTDDYTSSFGDASSGVGASSLGLYNLYSYVNTNSKELTEDIIIYVNPTGSDITGNGTIGNPFKTIQHAIDAIPNALNGYTATINISAGIYNDNIVLSGFGSTGVIKLVLAGDVVASTVTVLGCTVIITSNTSVHTISVNSMLIFELGNFHSWSTINWNIIGTRTTATEGSFSMCIARGSTAYFSGSVTLSGNTGTGISILACSEASFGLLSGSGLNIGVSVANLSKFTSSVNNLVASTKVSHSNGGMEIQPNGTQISGLISSGLSCTWGTIYQGYYRIGNTNGVALIVVDMTVVLTTTLSAGVQYIIGGFPHPTTGVLVNRHAEGHFVTALMEANGNIAVVPITTLGIGNTYLFSCTYVTNT